MAPVLLAAVVLLAALAATLLGADRARRPVDATELARDAVMRAIEAGSRDPEVHRALLDLRREIGRRPLDSTARAVYAALLLAVSREREETRVAAFHAGRAAETAPVTVPVVRYATHVLVRTGDAPTGLELIRGMFLYDPDAAADLLAEVAGLLAASQIAEALVDEPAAWLAWSRKLRELGRAEEAVARLREAGERWPRDPRVLRRLGAELYRTGDAAALASVLERAEPLPREPLAARLFAYRAWARARRGEPAAREDAAIALELDGADVRSLTLVGDALEALGDADGARSHWTRALFLLPAEDRGRIGLFIRMGRLEDRDGSPAGALRAWRSVLALEPEHVEAQRRVDDLTGFRR